MVDDVHTVAVEHGCEVTLCHSEADTVCNTLSERACCYLNTCNLAVLGVSRSLASFLTEVLEIVKCETVVKHMEKSIKHSGAVTGRKNETVAILPLDVLRAVLHLFCPKRVCHRHSAESDTRVTGFCLVDSFSRENAHRIDCLLFYSFHLFHLKKFFRYKYNTTNKTRLQALKIFFVLTVGEKSGILSKS